MIATTSPGCTSNEISFSTSASPKLFLMCDKRTTGFAESDMKTSQVSQKSASDNLGEQIALKEKQSVLRYASDD